MQRFADGTLSLNCDALHQLDRIVGRYTVDAAHRFV